MIAATRRNAIDAPDTTGENTTRLPVTPALAARSPEVAARAVARLFPEVYRRYHTAGQMAHAHLPVTRRGLEVLQHLAAGGPMTVGEQAAHLGLRRNSASELLARLEARGLVARIRDERDERRVLVWLTDAGRDVVNRIGEVLAPDLLSEVMADLAPEEREAVVRGFELLARARSPTRDAHDAEIDGPARPSRPRDRGASR